MIHKFNMNDLYIVVDTNSGAVHGADKIVYDILDYYPAYSLPQIMDKLHGQYSDEDIRESYEEISELEKSGYLFSQDIYEDIAGKGINRKPVIKALCLHVAHDCNLRCRYCFADEGEYHGRRALMSKETGMAAIDLLIRESGNRKNLEVDFFGGEPLMNFEVVKAIVEYGREQEKMHNKNFRFTMTTNGVLLDDKKLTYINEHMHNLVLSMDGRKEVNDNMRKCTNGTSSYDLIVPKFQKAAESRNQLNYYLRGTFTKMNLDFSEDVRHMADLGFKQISVEPVVAAHSEPYAITEEDVETIYAEYEKLAGQILDKHGCGLTYNFFHFMVDLAGGPCAYKRIAGCGAGTEYLAVTPEGQLFPCHQFVGMDDFIMGDVYTGVVNMDMRKTFEGCHVYAKEDCKGCWAKFYCSGGCAANAFNANGDILKPYEIGCKLQRKRTECAIMIKVHESIAAEAENELVV